MTRKRDPNTGDLFIEEGGQLRLLDKSAEQRALEGESAECLGRTFPNDEVRREYFLEKLREKLKDPEFRKTPGFPKGSDEDILRLSDPPYYTGCPNPFIPDFVSRHKNPQPSAEDYCREPFAADVTEGKTDPIYTAHSYHTKVPHKAIMRYILHYTRPGDVVFDGFCGSGMTGVAAQACASPDDHFRHSVEGSMPRVEWGARRCILVDLSPAATFLARGYNFPPSVPAFRSELTHALENLDRECRPLYNPGGGSGEFHYGVWTDVFACPECGAQFSFWSAAIDLEAWQVSSSFKCVSCGSDQTKTGLDRMLETYLDTSLGCPVSRGKYVMSIVNKTIAGSRKLVEPSPEDLALAEAIEQQRIPTWHPTEKMMFEDGQWGQMWRAGYHSGITHVHHFFTKRNLRCLALAWDVFSKLPEGVRLSAQYVFTGALQISSRMSQFRFDSRRKGSTAGGIMKGALFVPSLSKEGYVPDLIERRYNAILSQYEVQAQWDQDSDRVIISTGSSSATGCPDNAIDYIFVDPPFGANIIYSELNFLWESWLRVFTAHDEEAIVNDYRNKALPAYHGLMTSCFKECYRILKPGRWITVEFHNSQNSVWNVIQEAMQRSGFVVADVRTLDKKQGSFKQLTTKAAVKQDLVISAYKPAVELERRFDLEAGTEVGAWSFIKSHLKQLPVFVSDDTSAETVAERLAHLLFDRMVAFHVQRAVLVPISAADFYAGLAARFPVRDGMFFLSEQVSEYDKKRANVRELRQLSLFPTDEASAIMWMRQQLHIKPQTYQELAPTFMHEVRSWAQHEQTIELMVILEQNFLCYNGTGPVPSQIHSYLSTNFKDLRNLDKEDPALVAKAVDRWYVPDTSKQGDLEKTREKQLLREFEDYRTATQRKLKLFRTEAVRAGFKAAYDRQDYQTIVDVARNLPDTVLQEDEKLLMYYDVALTRLGED